MIEKIKQLQKLKGKSFTLLNLDSELRQILKVEYDRSILNGYIENNLKLGLYTYKMLDRRYRNILNNR